LEKPPDGRGIAWSGANRLASGRGAHGNRTKAIGAVVESLPQLSFNVRGGFLVRRPEAVAFERPTGRSDNDGNGNARSSDAQDEGHDQSQDTRVL